ncbi:hypothetical protein EKO27_g9822 [Xylaria grammica]|uniref:Uncharacterized protein n=1 Tax=Xylaria grammica TaxID=363999 RepID=A0A439CT59_9PEZI|nr:hypothetical protein EKO27_g9822 [Xylaria grammica]
MAQNSVRGPTVLITGCGVGGLGAALCNAFADSGYLIFAAARDPAKAAFLARAPSCQVIALDVTSKPSIDECVSKIRQKTQGRGLDVLVNNAGVGLTAPLLDTSMDDARRVFDVNVWGMLAVTQAFAPLLVEAKGTILNVSSIAGAVRLAWQETLRMELAPLDVRVVTAMVGEVETGFYGHATPFSLPAGSYYKAIEATIRKQSTGELQVNNQKAEDVARSLVKEVTGGGSGQAWHGGLAGTVKYASWLVPTKIFEWLLHRNRGLSDLAELNHSYGSQH